MEWMKLAIAVGDVGQAPKVEDLAWNEGTGCDAELAREADTTVWGNAACSGDKAGGSSHHRARIALDAARYLAHQLSWGQNHGKHVVQVGVRVRGLRQLGWTQENKNHGEKTQ